MFKHARLALAAILVASASTAAFAQGNGPKGNPNSQKYSNKGARPSTGRSGSASLETRVLIAKAGSMLIEASTGTVASGTGPGTITKAQVKVGDFTQNFNGLTAGGFFATTLPAATRGTAVQVQTNVKGIDPKRTDVVTVATPALLRPDIAVAAVNGPAQQSPNVPVTFFATVQEKNGDVGATADCTLSVNNTVVGTAAAIWVDAAGTVSCQFSHAFAAPGTYNVTATAGNVVPGDWDDANNTASTTITIVEPNKQIKNGYMGAEQRNTVQRYYENRQNGYYCGYYYYYCNYIYDRTYVHNLSNIWFNGWMNGTASGPIQRVDFSQYQNGNLQFQASLTPSSSWSYDYGYQQQSCDYYNNTYWDGSRYVHSRAYFDTCSYAYPGNEQSNYTYFNAQVLAGDVVYQGSDMQCDYYYYGYCSTYYWLDQYSYGGVPTHNWTVGSDIRLKIDFVGANGVSHTADRSVTLTDRSGEVNYYYSGSWYDYYYGYNYYWQQGWGTLYGGNISWYDGQ